MASINKGGHAAAAPTMSKLLLIFQLTRGVLAGPVVPDSFKLHWANATIDHFGWQPLGSFQQRFFVDDSHWDKAGGPILFYTGNEAPIEEFIANTGWMAEIAPELKVRSVVVVYTKSSRYLHPPCVSWHRLWLCSLSTGIMGLAGRTAAGLSATTPFHLTRSAFLRSNRRWLTLQILSGTSNSRWACLAAVFAFP